MPWAEDKPVQKVFEVGQRVQLPKYFTVSRGYIAGAAAYCEPRYPGAANDDNIYFWPVSITMPGWTTVVVVNGAHLTSVPQHEDKCPTCSCMPNSDALDPTGQAAELGS